MDGGERFTRPTVIDDKVVAAIEELAELAPLHNRPSLAAIRIVRKALGPSVPTTETFDTTFHRTMPEKAFRYAIPSELADKHGARRYGFRGLAHRYMSERYTAISGSRQEKAASLDGDRSAEGVSY